MRSVIHAPELTCDNGVWLNSERALRLEDFKGRLILLDVFTSCCINCRHVIATLNRLEQERPHVQVIGLHAPKFSAERHPAVAAAAVKRLGIRHPVLHDPDRDLMTRYAARAWPTLIFIDPAGRILGASSGEPDYGRLLEAVDALTAQLRDAGGVLETPALLTPPAPPAETLRFPAKVQPLAHRPGLAVAESGGHRVILLDLAGREIGRFGGDAPGFVDGDAQTARFSAPEGVACDETALYVADTGNHALRRIDLATGRTETLAGVGERGGVLGAPEIGRGCALASPADLALTPYGLAFANAGTHQLGLFTPQDGAVTALAGAGFENLVDGPAMEAGMAQPSGLCYAPEDDALYVVDAETSALRRLVFGDGGRLETLIGAGLFDWGDADGAFSRARLQHPQAVTRLGPRRLAVADSYNDAVRLVDLSLGRVTTLRRRDGDARECEAAGICTPHAEPAGLCALSPHRLILAETNRHRLVQLDLLGEGDATATALP